MTDNEINTTLGIDLAEKIPERTSVEKFFDKLFGMRAADIMSAFQGKRESGLSRVPFENPHSTKRGPGRKHLQGPGRDPTKSAMLIGRLTRSSGRF